MEHFPAAAVLTGDIVSSRRATDADLDDAMQRIASAAADIADDSALTIHQFDRFRGDGWQLFLPSAALALRATLRIVAHLG